MRCARVLIVLGLIAGMAVAQGNRGLKLFEEGRALAAKGNYVEACEKFDQSLQLDRAPGTALNYGDCLENLGQWRKAWFMYDSAAKDFARVQDGRAKFARSRAKKVEEKLVRVVLNVEDYEMQDLVITIGKTSVAVREQIIELVEPGDVEITARGGQYKDFTARAR